MGFIFAILFLICILWAIFYFELSRLMATAMVIFASLFAAIFISPWSLLLGSVENYRELIKLAHS